MEPLVEKYGLPEILEEPFVIVREEEGIL